MHRSRRIVALVATIVLFCSGCDWLQWGNGAGHAGAILESAITKANIAGFVSSTMLQLPVSSPAVTAHGLVFVERDGRLTALDAKSYGVVWSAVLPSGATAGGAPAIHGASGTIFVVVAGASNPVLLGFDVDGVRHCNAALDTCSPVFRANLGTSSGPASPPVVSGNRILANGAGSVYAFDATGQAGCVSSLGTAVCTPLWAAPTGFAASGIGPAAANGVVYDPVNVGGTFALGAFDEGSGAPLWNGSLGASPATATPSVGSDGTVFVPTGSVVAAFNGDGCGATTCARSYNLAQKTGDPVGAFLDTPATDGSLVYATNATGRLYAWPNTGCAPSCQPSWAATVDAPAGGSSAYRQSPVIANGVLFLLSRQVVGGAGHVVLLALDEDNGNPLASFDLGAGGFGAGLANASVATGVVYAPIAGALVAVHAKPVQPLASLSTSALTLSPAFAPSTFDYVVRCRPGTNSLTITMSAQAGGTVALVAPITTSPSPSQVNTVQLTENQAAVIQAADAQGARASYWIRCLPNDFPPLTVAAHPSTGKPTPGWYLIADNITPSATAYAMILDTNGTPVWYKRGAPQALNVTPLGHDSVAFMPNETVTGFGVDPNGRYDVHALDSNQVSTIRTVGMPTDLHELYPLPNGDHLLLSYPLKRGVDLTGLPGTPTPGPNSTIADCVVQDVDAQGQLVWQWTASDHIDPVTETTLAQSATIDGETVYDVFHCNSIDPSAGGDLLLVSARHLNAVFEIRRSDGKVVWKMGGKPVNKDGAAIIQIQNDPDGGIVQQHDARYLPSGHISLYDNQSFASNLPARGVEYALNQVAKTAQLVFSFATPTGAPSCCMGSLRRYPDGHRVIGWGYVLPSNGAAFTELDAAGNDVLDVSIAAGHATYRAVKAPPTRFDIRILRATAGQ